MVQDYNKLMHAAAAKASGARLLLHVCCAPCSSSVLPRLSMFAVTPFYYNPNIDTAAEYELRYAQFALLDVEPIKESYDHEAFLRLVHGLEGEPEGGARCRVCIAHRLEETAKRAAAEGYDFFCSTLSVSPHKDAAFINRTGQTLAQKYGVEFLPNDFKKEDGFLQSTRISRACGMYRQDYCGCEFAKGRRE